MSFLNQTRPLKALIKASEASLEGKKATLHEKALQGHFAAQ